jgi:hypothetical protein
MMEGRRPHALERRLGTDRQRGFLSVMNPLHIAISYDGENVQSILSEIISFLQYLSLYFLLQLNIDSLRL